MNIHLRKFSYISLIMSKDYSEDLLIKNSTLDHLHPKVDEWRN